MCLLGADDACLGEVLVVQVVVRVVAHGLGRVLAVQQEGEVPDKEAHVGGDVGPSMHDC